MNTPTPHASRPTPWYTEPWPWIVMAGPAAVVVAGAFTMTIAFRTADTVVTEPVKGRPAIEASRNP